MIPCRGRLEVGPLPLEQGGSLPRVELAFETWGRWDPQRKNAILVCHALTGDAHVAAHDPQDRPGWWEAAVGPGRPIDTRRWFVLCSNVLGSCYGSTGPSSPVDPKVPEARWGGRFPTVTVRDMVHAQRRLLDALGIDRLALVVGGSLGGMQALEWAVSYPDRVDAVAVLAAPPASSPHAIAWNEAQRQAIFADPAWQGGDYPPERPPRRGLALARMIAMATYRGRDEWAARFGRDAVPPDDDPVAARIGLYATAPRNEAERFRFQIESYLHYQGEKLVRRFDAASYVTLTRAMDLHDVGRDRGGLDQAVARVRGRVYVLSIASDLLYPVEEQRRLVRALRRAGKDVTWHVWRAPWGHDSFLVDAAGVAQRVMDWLDEPGQDAAGLEEGAAVAVGEGRP
ncbi:MULTISPECIES: homoserine O-acetyltransferase MetX [Thermaerobacter]|uniref:Homoserine O-acetyltransferase n=1 Tax=Thermaerobacter composti TaxID=554949 RepID=A0ABZ0QKN3_9FIRM|nr:MULTISPECIES: homoserine O-acetyltransferase [Thermaerobacter]QBS38048.1 homoserine O-acetyltransferase [Thermaerobacter sp. FW80]WPD18061.1 homoserine O-acetyltransferase [Thermaerobacter composti]